MHRETTYMVSGGSRGIACHIAPSPSTIASIRAPSMRVHSGVHTDYVCWLIIDTGVVLTGAAYVFEGWQSTATFSHFRCQLLLHSYFICFSERCLAERLA